MLKPTTFSLAACLILPIFTTMQHVGIDYGSKMAGTTVVCWADNNSLIVRQSTKKQDADKFIKQLLNDIKPSEVFLDAPLSLPKAYFDNSSSDFFYRACDKVLGAMSPMFLGGLTARAMKLNKEVDLKMSEAYPAALVKELDLKEHYKKDIEKFVQHLNSHLSPYICPSIENWHQIDAVLAWLTGCRVAKGDHKTIGEEGEGLIFV